MSPSSGKADLHIHTCYSDGHPTVRAVLDHVARRSRLQVIAITDHDTIEGALEARIHQHRYSFAIIVGEEVSSRDGHILGLFLERRIPPGLSAAETIVAIHEQNGLAIAAHLFIDWPFPSQRIMMQGVGRRISTLPFDGVEVDNSTPFLRPANFRARHYNRAFRQLPEIGNSDAHIVEAIGKGYTRFSGTTAADLRLAIESGACSAHHTFYGPRELLLYGRFWLQSCTPRRPAEAGSE